MIASLKSEMTIAYVDDVGLGGDAGVIANDFQRIKEMGSEIGLTLNRAKCEVIGHDNATRAIFQDFRNRTTEHDDARLTDATRPRYR